MRTSGLVPEWDDRLWDHVWERNLTQVERHNTGLAVLRHRPPGSPFEDLVARELAHRWRRRALTLGVMWAAWTLFWGALAVGPWPDGEGSPLPLACALFGLVVIASCVIARRRFLAYLRLPGAWGGHRAAHSVEAEPRERGIDELATPPGIPDELT